jgi:hypothetical protein
MKKGEKNKSGDCPIFASKQGNQPKLPFIKAAASAHTFLMPKNPSSRMAGATGVMALFHCSLCSAKL